MDFTPVGGEITSSEDGLKMILIGLLRNTPGGAIRIPFEDTTKLTGETVHVELVTGATGAYVDVSLVRIKVDS